MDSKRKSNGHPADAEDRYQKRRKLSEIDLSKGESAETTTAYGLSFLEQIRRTADKSGRLVATYFEKLIPREGNAEYYKKTRLPVSLELTEEKLKNGDFQNLAELESFFKRMIANAKEFYPRSSQIFEDAERVRKALSNYMTKTNPAYSTRGYQAVPTPLPPEEEVEEEQAEEQAEEEAEEQAEEEAEEQAEEEAEEQEEEAEEEAGEDPKGQNGANNEEDAKVENGKTEPEGGDDPEAEGDKADEDVEGEEAGVEDAAAEDDDAEVAEEEAGEDGAGTRSRRSIILKRRRPGRPPKPVAPARPDHEYENVAYKGLTFQQAQEKIVEEILRHREPGYDDVHFEPFINLPSRSLRDYFKIITDPLSLKKLQKMVKGVQGRNDATRISEFKSWSAFEEKSKLLWTNAFFYNEEGSEIYLLAQDLEKQFYAQLKKAQAVVQEPAQPKIKLKVGQGPAGAGAETPGSSKKITIHVGGRSGSIESPAPHTASSTEPANDVVMSNGTARPTKPPSHLEMVHESSAPIPSPAPVEVAGVKAEGSVPAVSPPILSAPYTPRETPAHTPGLAVRPPVPVAAPPPIQSQPLANGFVEHRRHRAPGKGIDHALISRLRVQTHPNIQTDRPILFSILPSAREMQQSATIHLPPYQSRVLIIATLPPFLQDRQYSMWTLIDKQPLKQCIGPVPGQGPQDRAFDVLLHPGLNVIEAHLIAAIPRNEREPGGVEVELEIFTVVINVARI